MPRGGKRKGSGAPRGNKNTVKHGLYSKSILAPEDVEAFERHFAALAADPRTALLAGAALIHAHVERVIRTSKDGILTTEMHEEVGGNGTGAPPSWSFDADALKNDVADSVITKIKRVELTLPVAEALLRASRIAVNAHLIDKLATMLPVEHDTAEQRLKLLEAGVDPDAMKAELHIHADAIEE